jgi:hypothetical protein
MSLRRCTGYVTGYVARTHVGPSHSPEPAVCGEDRSSEVKRFAAHSSISRENLR